MPSWWRKRKAKRARKQYLKQANAALQVLKDAGLVPHEAFIAKESGPPQYLVANFYLHRSRNNPTCHCVVAYGVISDSWDDIILNDKYQHLKCQLLVKMINATDLGCEPALARLVSSWVK